MDQQQIAQTPVWALYEKGRAYHHRTGIYTDTDRNYRFYNGDQWAGAKLGDAQPVQKNFIRSIVKYKLSVIHDNLYAPVFSPGTWAQDPQAQELCTWLGRYCARVWEQDKLDAKGRRITKDAAINDEGILYVDFDPTTGLPKNEVIKKNDIYYGNENDEDLQAQPYILIRKRIPLAQARELAKGYGFRDLDRVTPDSDNATASGAAAKEELGQMVTVIHKLYRLRGVVHFSVATKTAQLVTGRSTGLTCYPVAHFLWESREGSARGEGEVRYLIPNQIEVNRTEVRRVRTVKFQAYPQKIVDAGKIANPQALNQVGGIIRTNGAPVEDVHKILGTLQPAQMSPDVVRLQEDLIRYSRELAGAGDSATGQVDPATTSGRAILAVQQASQAPMTEQKEGYKQFLEEVVRIWLGYLQVYGCREISPGAVGAIQAQIRIDVTPKSVYDRFAQEQTIENLLVQGLFRPDRVEELDTYAQLLDDDSVAPRQKILKAVAHIRDQQLQIARLQARAQQAIQAAGRELEMPRAVGEEM